MKASASVAPPHLQSKLPFLRARTEADKEEEGREGEHLVEMHLYSPGFIFPRLR